MNRFVELTMRYASYLSAILLVGTVLSGGAFVLAQEAEPTSEEIQSLNKEISQKKGNIDQINKQIGEYKKQIEKKQAEKASLASELELLDNRIAKTELEIEETKQTIDLTNTELVLLQQQLSELELKMNKNKALMMGVLHEIQVSDQELPLNVFFGSDSLSELFDEVHALETINQDLKQALDKIKNTKQLVEEKRAAQEVKRAQMEQMELALEKEKQQLEQEISAQGVLIAQTQRSEDAFRALVQELKEEQSFINQQISALQKEIEAKLSVHDEAGDSSVLSWPIDPSKKGISATYHDPTYPFRHLFEHSGIDLPAPTGTPIKAAGPGYVAWTKKGKQYGNYVMIIHANGLATLYAHMSRIDVSVDQFVPRGAVIGAVGSTGLSTGPHVHFEVRKNGIPTNPLNYLVSQ